MEPRQDPITPLDLYGPLVFSRSVIYPSSTRGWRYDRIDIVERGSDAFNVVKRCILAETGSIRGFGSRLLVYKSTENFYTRSAVEKYKCHEVYRDLSSQLKSVKIISSDRPASGSLISRIFSRPNIEETSFIDDVTIEKHIIADPATYVESVPNRTVGSESPTPNRTKRTLPRQYYRPIDQIRYKHTIKDREALLVRHPPKRRDIDSKESWRSTPPDDWTEFVERFQGSDILAVCVMNEGHVINAILRHITSIRTIIVPNYDFLEGIDVAGMLIIQVNV